MSDRWLWARDWAIIGGVTCTIGPWMASELPLGPGFAAFVRLCAVLGLVSGVGVGLVLHAVLTRAPTRTWMALCATVVPGILGAWGGGVSGSAAWVHVPDMVLLAVPCGSAAAILQTAWLAPIYSWLAGRGSMRLPFVLTGAVLGAPVAGVVAVIVGLWGLRFFGAVTDLLG